MLYLLGDKDDAFLIYEVLEHGCGLYDRRANADDALGRGEYAGLRGGENSPPIPACEPAALTSNESSRRCSRIRLTPA
jgi:hypothetical protein